jgi:hypothetical protein
MENRIKINNTEIACESLDCVSLAQSSLYISVLREYGNGFRKHKEFLASFVKQYRAPALG